MRTHVIPVATANIQSRTRRRNHGFRIVNARRPYGPTANNDVAKTIANQPIRFGKVKRAYLGFSSQQVDVIPKLAQYHGLKNRRVLFVVSVEPNSPAGHVGTRDGDFIVAFNSVPIESSDDLFKMLTEEKIGIFQDVTVIRHDKKIDLRGYTGGSEDALMM